MSSVETIAEGDVDAWYDEIIVKTLKSKEEALSRARSRFQLAEALMVSVRMDVHDAQKEVKKWRKKAADGRIHCPRLKARASARKSVAAPMGEVSSESTSSSSTSSSSSPSSLSTSSSEEAEESHSTLEESSESTLVASESTSAVSVGITEQEWVEARTGGLTDAMFNSFLEECGA